jgi:hypothetical protein
MYLLGSGLNPFRGFFLFIGNWCFADANIGYHRCMAIKRPPNVIQRLCRFFGPVEPVAGVRTRKRIATLKDVGLGFGEDRACGNELFSNSPQAWASPNDPRLLAGRLPCYPIQSRPAPSALSRSSIIRLGGRDAGIGSGTGQSSIARATVASSPAFPTLGTSRHMARTIRKR